MHVNLFPWLPTDRNAGNPSVPTIFLTKSYYIMRKRTFMFLRDCLNWHILSHRPYAWVTVLITMCFTTTGCVHDKDDYPPDMLQAFERIDSIMSVHDRIIADKEQQLNQMRMLQDDLDDRGRVGLYHRLFDAYYSYDFDSAAYYARLKYDAAFKVRDSHAMAQAKVNIAKTELALGNEIIAMDTLKSLAQSDTARYADVKKGYYDAIANHQFAKGNPADKEFQWLIENSRPGSMGLSITKRPT